MPPTFLVLETSRQPILPRRFRTDDTRGPEMLTRYLLRRYSRRGDVVLDPFAGFGTTIHLSEQMGRIGYGIERDAERVAYARSRLADPARVALGDARDVRSFGFPKFDLCLTSPPYMTQDDSRNALSADGKGGYARYLTDLVRAFRGVRRVGRDGARIIVEITNLRIDSSNRRVGSVTPLAWDVADRLSTIFEFEGELVIGWTGRPLYRHGGSYGYGYDHSYCLVFRRGPD